jgi:DNA (cytosine-5)-methyltransferase 1
VRPLLLDLYCCQGGIARGFHDAGFDVVGVDKDPQPRYPFAFIQADVFEFLRGLDPSALSFVHASPPCQHDSVLSKSHNGRAHEHPDLIAPTREALLELGVPFTIENVAGARHKLIDPIMLCGTMFDGLRVTRHRYFECHGFDPGPTPLHGRHPLHYTRDKRKGHYGRLDEMTAFVMVNGGGNCSKAAAADAMGIDWMTKGGLNEAIPPAYGRWLGERTIRALWQAPVDAGADHHDLRGARLRGAALAVRGPGAPARRGARPRPDHHGG